MLIKSVPQYKIKKTGTDDVDTDEDVEGLDDIENFLMK